MHNKMRKAGEKKETQSLARSSAVFFTFQRCGGWGEKEKAYIVKEKTKLWKRGKKGGQRTVKLEKRSRAD